MDSKHRSYLEAKFGNQGTFDEGECMVQYTVPIDSMD
jgi:hypothetical protein